MNRDKAPEFIEQGEYSYALNIRPFNPSTGSIGVITNVEGNELVDYTFDDIGTGFLRVIGSHLDEKRRRMYWFVYGNNDSNTEKAYIIYYSYETKTVTTVFSYDNMLGFGQETQFQSVNIIYDDSIGDTIKWVADGEPREINVTAGVNRFNYFTTAETGLEVGDIVFADVTEDRSSAILFVPCICVTDTNDLPTYNYISGQVNEPEWDTLPVGDCYPPFILDSLFYQKTMAPRFSPSSTYNYDDGTGDANGSATFLRRRSFEFMYKYVMFDGQETEWSPVSEAVFSQEVTSIVFAEGATPVDISYPTPLSVSVKVPISTYRRSGTTIDDFVEFPNAMIARVRIAIREVPSRETPSDWLLLQDVDFEDFYKYNLSELPISEGFPISGSAGTYFYNWDTKSYNVVPSGQSSNIVTITIDYDGSQTLTPLDIIDTSTLYYKVPKDPATQTISGNRTFFGGGSDSIDVSRDVASSIENQVSLSAKPYLVDLDIENQETELNTWISGATFTQIKNSDRTVEVQFSLNEVLDIADYEDTFYYDFNLNLEFEWEFIAGFPPSITSNLSRQISGTSQGIPSQYADFETFLTTVVKEAYSDMLPENVGTGNIILDVVSVDNSTGELTMEFDLNPLIPLAEFTNIDLAFISPDDLDFYIFRGYLPERTFKDNSTQQYGVAFSDETGRITPTITGDWGRVEIPRVYSDTFEARKFLVEMDGLSGIDVPTEAKTMHIVRKRSESYSEFIQFSLSRGNCPSSSWNSSSGSQYVIGSMDLELDSPTPLSSSDKFLYISLNAVNGGDGAAYESKFRASILSFLPQQGDVFRFLYKQDDTSVVDEVYDDSYNILGYNELFNTIVLDWNDIVSKNPSLAAYLEADNSIKRVMCDITKKTTSSEQELYWEVAAQLSCTDGAVDIDSTNDSILLFGDTYLKVRGYCINYDGSPNPTYQNYVLQDRNYNDFAKTANSGEGRPNKTIKVLRRGDNIYSDVNRDNLIRYSEQSIQNTDVRKFSTLFETNIQEVDNIFGRIEHLDGEGDKLNIYQEDKMSYGYVGRAITTELSEASRVIASQGTVLSDIIYSSFSGGISLDSTSFAKSGYRKYFTDSKRGSVYRQSMDGVTPISEVGMSGAFKELFRKIRNSYVTPIIRGIVDERTDEYILSVTYSLDLDCEVVSRIGTFLTVSPPADGSYFDVFANGATILADVRPNQSSTELYTPESHVAVGNQSVGGQFAFNIKIPDPAPEGGDTIRVTYPQTEVLVFSERTGGWTTYLSYDAEWLETGIQSYHTFVNGEMWIHDLGATDYNSFHERVFPSELEITSNENPNAVKEWRTVALKSNFSNFSVEDGDISTSMEQLSYIPSASFATEEGTKKSPFYNDSNEDILTGSRLKGRWLRMKITADGEDDVTEELKLYGAMFHSVDSPQGL